MEMMFNDILEKDEKVIKAYKPNKTKYWWSVNLSMLLMSLWFFFMIGISVLGGLSEDRPVTSKDVWLTVGITVGIYAVIHLIVLFFAKLNYQKRFYAYTNKRVIIRSGIIGVDYKSLEFKNLTATIVNVSLIDKMVKKNTGTLVFGSPASPLNGVGAYMFKHILKPYDTLREIKELIDAKEKEEDKKKAK